MLVPQQRGAALLLGGHKLRHGLEESGRNARRGDWAAGKGGKQTWVDQSPAITVPFASPRHPDQT